jgi:hypothetical protein
MWRQVTTMNFIWNFLSRSSIIQTSISKIIRRIVRRGNDGDGSADIAGLGGDFSSYLRLLLMQELPDKQSLLGQMVLTNNEYSNLVACQWILAGTFSRAFYEISIANEFWDRLQRRSCLLEVLMQVCKLKLLHLELRLSFLELIPIII